MTDSYALDKALMEGRDDGLIGNVNRNPYDQRTETKLWVQYERGYTAGNSRRVGTKAIAALRRKE